MSISKIKGKWRITEMEQWDNEFIHVEEPGWIEFLDQGNGSFHFGYVYVDLGYRIDDTEKNSVKIDFTFSGYDVCDEVSGRGWVKIQGQALHGYFYFHQGDESTFKAVLEK